MNTSFAQRIQYMKKKIPYNKLIFYHIRNGIFTFLFFS